MKRKRFRFCGGFLRRFGSLFRSFGFLCGNSAVCSGAVCSVCAVSFAAVSCLPDAQPVMSTGEHCKAKRSAKILLFIFGPPMNGDSEHRITMMRLVKRFCDICPVKTKNILKHSIMSNAYDKAGARNRLKKTVARWQKCWYTIYLGRVGAARQERGRRMNFDGFLGNDALKRRLQESFRQGQNLPLLPALRRGRLRAKDAGAFAWRRRWNAGTNQIPAAASRPACRKVLSKQHPDVITVDDTEHKNVAVDIIRQARSDVFIRPNEGRKKVYILPRGQDLGAPSQNALLKILEEPPDYAVFLLLTTSAEKLLPTIRSRAVHCSSHRSYPVKPCRSCGGGFRTRASRTFHLPWSRRKAISVLRARR